MKEEMTQMSEYKVWNVGSIAYAMASLMWSPDDSLRSQISRSYHK